MSSMYVADLKNVLASGSIVEQKTFLKSFVKSIDVSRSEVTVNYTHPMPPLNVDKETVGVLNFTWSGELVILPDQKDKILQPQLKLPEAHR